MFDAFSRPITYLRVSVTDRCNLRCTYCTPGSLKDTPHLCSGDILRFEEIEAVVAYGVKHGIRKVRLTGGEPLMRRGIVSLVEKLARMEGIDDLGMTTNGTQLRKYANALRAAGLHRLNISLDTLDASEFSRSTGGGKLAEVLDGIDAAREAGFGRIKLNCVVAESKNEPAARKVGAFGEQEGLEVRYIRRMNLTTGEFWEVIGGEGGKCDRCNRLRLAATGEIYPCLFSNESFSVRRLGIARAFNLALRHKPACGHKSDRLFYQIGG